MSRVSGLLTSLLQVASLPTIGHKEKHNDVIQVQTGGKPVVSTPGIRLSVNWLRLVTINSCIKHLVSSPPFYILPPPLSSSTPWHLHDQGGKQEAPENTSWQQSWPRLFHDSWSHLLTESVPRFFWPQTPSPGGGGGIVGEEGAMGGVVKAVRQVLNTIMEEVVATSTFQVYQ